MLQHLGILPNHRSFRALLSVYETSLVFQYTELVYSEMWQYAIYHHFLS